MKNILSVFLSVLMVLGCTSLAFADSNSPNLQPIRTDIGQFTEVEILNAIDGISDPQKKDKITQYIFTPIYVTYGTEPVDNYILQNQDIISQINFLSQLSFSELDAVISKTLKEKIQLAKNSSNIYFLKSAAEFINEYSPEQIDIIETTTMNRVLTSPQEISLMALTPDRDYTRQYTMTYNTLTGAAIKFTMYLDWSVRNNVISKYTPTYTYWTNGLWSLDRCTMPTSSLYNAGQRGNVLLKGWFSNNILPTFTTCTVDAWFYNDGGCDFNEY